MLRPERMSRVSVAGSHRVLQDVIEAVHDLRLIDFSRYDGSIEGFDQGTPLTGAEEASDTLVTIRSLESILAVEEADAGPKRIVTDEAVEEQLEELRSRVNELEDRRSTLESDRQAVADRIDSAQPFLDLGIDLDLLRGYDSLEVAVGRADPDAVRDVLADAEGVSAFEVFGDDPVAAFVQPAAGSTDVLDQALVGVEFEHYEIPEASGDPDGYVADLEAERDDIESRLTGVATELETLREEYAGFLLAVEEAYSIEVQKTEVPLEFATTEHAFVAEGWIPAETYEAFASAVDAATDGRVVVDELEVAQYDEYAPHESHGPADDEDTEATGSAGRASGAGTGQPASTAQAETAGSGNAAGETVAADSDDDQEAAEQSPTADGGTVAFDESDEPPVILDNPSPASPFELLVNVINRPNYWELDPTVVLLLTFPVFFGFMIGDVGYGILYAAIGYTLVRRSGNDALKSLGGIAVWAGGFTVLFGLLYGEVFGLHVVGEVLWGGHPPMHKGLQPRYIAYAQAWLFLMLVVALGHLTTGFVFGFRNHLTHGVREAVLEKGSWILLMVGVWAWIFSQHLAAAKPDLLFAVFNRAGAPLPGGGTVAPDQVAYSLGFAGLPASVGVAGLALVGVGFVMLVLGEGGIGALESLNVLVNVLSYTRIAAVLLAKAGMAFVVNLLFFGGYRTAEGAMHFYGLTEHAAEHGTELFGGLVHMGPAGWLGGIIVLVLGHLLVLALGITSAGLQAVRLEYVEFFGKFYEGGGDKYDPFGYQRQYTTED